MLGITISSQQVKIARKLTAQEINRSDADLENMTSVELGDGTVRYLELDAEKMGYYFGDESRKTTFDCVWISEAMSHLPDKELFFRNTEAVLNPGGRLIIADWFRAEELTDSQMKTNIKPIEGVNDSGESSMCS